MIIHQPELHRHNDDIIAHAKIELRQPQADFPEHLWYKIPERFSQHISLQSDAFLIPGLLAGMYYQEDIEVRGVVSPRLAYQLEEYQYLLNFRMPNIVTPVDIKYTQLQALNEKPEAVGTAFSGGVDSFFTLLNNLPQNQPIPEYQITHALFIHGYDILNKDRSKYQAYYSRFHDALKQIDVELVSMETNLFSFIAPRMKLNLFYGPVLIGSAHVFGNLFRKFFVSSSNDYWQIKKWTSSSDPTSDPLLSTETMEIIHYGAATRRVEKIEAISNWKPAQENLRVCLPDDMEEISNCSRCEKCVRTMIPIYALGKMEKFITFEKPLRSDRESLWWARKFDPSKYFVKESSGGFIQETFDFIRKHKPTMIPWLRMAILLGTIRYWCLKLIPRPVKKRLQRFGYFIDPLIQDYAFDNPEVNQFIESSNKSEQ